jgi:hypothetical protein
MKGPDAFAIFLLNCDLLQMLDLLQYSLTRIKTHADAPKIMLLHFIDSLVYCFAEIRASNAADD